MENPINNLNTLHLLEKIQEWSQIDLRTASDYQISNQMLKTLTTLIVSNVELTNDNLIYRVRSIEEGQQFFRKDEVWYLPSSEIKKRGRINGIGESMFYCSLDQVTPLYECSIKEGDWYAIMQYKIKDQSKLQLTNVINEELTNDLNDTGKINKMIINQFIKNEFTKPVGVGTEYLYKVSNLICRNFMDIPNCDGYLYPSIARFSKGYNLALKPKSVDNLLEFDTLLICKRGPYDIKNNLYNFFLKHKAKLKNNYELEYEF